MLGVGHTAHCSHWAGASDCLGRLQQITHRLLLRHQQRKQHTGICSHQSISNYPDSFYQQIWASENLNGSHQHLLSFFIPKQIHLSFLLQTSRLETNLLKIQLFSKAFINLFPKLQRTKVISVLFADIKGDVSSVARAALASPLPCYHIIPLAELR